jgi:protein ImuA
MDAMPSLIASPAASAPLPRARGGLGAGANEVRRPAPPPPETLHPDLWLGHQLGRQVDHTVPSGFPALDAELPGGGWPRRVLSELLLSHSGVGEMRLLSRCLAQVQAAGRLVMLFDPPEELCAWALSQMGLDVSQLLVINTRCKPVPGSDSLWALEQALKSGHVGAVLAWLPPRLRAERLRRLQLAAHAHDGPAFVIREMAAQQRPTAAPLRLALKPGGADVLNLRVLKRRGPPLESPIRLDLPPVLPAAAQRRAAQAQAKSEQDWPASMLSQVLQTATFINLAS